MHVTTRIQRVSHLQKGESVFECPLCPFWKTLKQATLKRRMRVVHGRSKRNLSIPKAPSQKSLPKAPSQKRQEGLSLLGSCVESRHKVVPHKRRGEEGSEGDDESEVEAIVGKAMRDGVVQYVV